MSERVISIEEAERLYTPANNLSPDDRGRSDLYLHQPFGHDNARWQHIKKTMQAGDEIVIYRRGSREWVVLRRNGEHIFSILTAM